VAARSNARPASLPECGEVVLDHGDAISVVELGGGAVPAFCIRKAFAARVYRSTAFSYLSLLLLNQPKPEPALATALSAFVSAVSDTILIVAREVIVPAEVMILGRLT